LDVVDYELVIPRKVTEDGHFLSHDLNHHYANVEEESDVKATDGGRRRRRSVGAAVNYHISVGLLGHEQPLHLELWPSSDFLAPGLVVERRADNQTTPKRSPPTLEATQCHYQGAIRGQPGSQVAISACNGLVSDSSCTVQLSARADTHLRDPDTVRLIATEIQESSLLGQVSTRLFVIRRMLQTESEMVLTIVYNTQNHWFHRLFPVIEVSSF
jgi:hypothetical protein